jgi:ABC-type dipeptide/oligopeptide/nickel transport system permease component
MDDSPRVVTPPAADMRPGPADTAARAVSSRLAGRPEHGGSGGLLALLGLATGRLPRRAAQAMLTLFAASAVVWALDSVAPGDPAQRVLAARGVRTPSPAQLSAMRHTLGLDRPLLERYLTWLTHALGGDFGTSYTSGITVRTEIASRVGATLILAGSALVLVIVIATVLGLLSAAFVGRWPDLAVRVLTVLGAATPAFVIGLVVLQLLVVRLHLGVVLSTGSIRDVFLPALCVAVGAMGVPTRVLRAAVVAATGEQYALLARARGARRRYVLVRHGLPNATVPLVQALALSAAWMIGGTVVVETVFTWPGLGLYLVSSVQQRDLPVVQAGAMLATLAYILTSLAADLIGGWVDPRVRNRL